MQIGDVREALADAARAVALPVGLRKLTCTGFTPDAPTEPHFFPGAVDITFDKAYGRGQDELEVTCYLFVSRNDDRAAQKLLDLMLSGAGPASLKAAIEAARGAPGEHALGGAADDLHVTRVQGYRWYEHAGVNYLGAEIIVRVIGDGST